MLEKEIPESELGNFPTLVSIVERLRAPGGCPWDREQTHASLKRNLLEECYEVLEAIDRSDPGPLAEELGDLLVQIVFHADIAEKNGEFNLADVVAAVNRKLLRRHPHVFGNVEVGDAREVERNWERLKAQERAEKGISKSPVQGIPKDLPALVYAQLMQDRVARAGFEWKDVSGVLDKVQEEVEELRRAGTDGERLHEMGDLLLVLVNLCRWLDFQAEDALRQANARFSARYLLMEELAEGDGEVFGDLPLEEKEAFWQKAKKLEE